jgi:hypothetical protein
MSGIQTIHRSVFIMATQAVKLYGILKVMDLIMSMCVNPLFHKNTHQW